MSRVICTRWLATAGVIVVAASLVFAVGGASASRALVAYNVYPLVSDSASVAAPLQDPSLVNGWGLSASATSPWWTSNNGTNTSTLYSGLGSKTALTVTVPGGPTGTVANSNTADFVVSQNGVSSSARFLFDTQGGQLLGWSPTVNATAAETAGDD